VPHVGQELTDPVSGARLRFRETARSSNGERVTMELEVADGWSAGPLHVHPAQSERMRVTQGVFRARSGPDERMLQVGDRIDVPPGTPHTISLVGRTGMLEAEFVPALRTDELFELMFAATFPRRPPRFVPAALRAWVESRGFADEIRYLWPRRLAALVAALGVLRLVGRRPRGA
jgi:mannose-6-phosphate isomerase-like protein (cupin superfamily)